MSEVKIDRAQGCTCFRLRRTARRVTQIYDAHLLKAGLTLTQYSLLANLVRSPTPSIQQLAETMGMDRTTVTRDLNPLKGRRLVELVPGEDRRSKLVRLTGDGRSAWDAAKGLWRAAQDDVEAKLGLSTVAELHRLLDVSFEALGD